MTLVKLSNSLALPISKSAIEELGWDENTQLRETVVEGKLVIEAVKGPKYTLEQLTARVTPQNRHGEIGTGPSVGNEF